MSYHSSHEKKAPLSLSEIFIRMEKQNNEQKLGWNSLCWGGVKTAWAYSSAIECSPGECKASASVPTSAQYKQDSGFNGKSTCHDL